MATSDYNSSLDLRLPLYPDTKPSYDAAVFADINALFTACRILAEGLTIGLASKIDDAPSDGSTYGRKDAAWVAISGGGINSVVAGTNVTVDNTDPLNPVVSATGGSSLHLLTHPTYQTTFINNSTITTAPMTTNSLRVGRLLIPATVKVTPQVRVTTAVASSKFTAALYLEDTSTGLPGVKFADLGEVDCSSVGVKTLAQLTIPAGEYFLVWHASLTASVYYAEDVLAGNPNKRYDLATAAVVASYSATLAYANPLPTPFSYTITPGTTLFRTPIFFRIDA